MSKNALSVHQSTPFFREVIKIDNKLREDGDICQLHVIRVFLHHLILI